MNSNNKTITDSTNKNIGIFDIDGINLNPLNNEPYSDHYKTLAKIWSKFPAYEQAHHIINQLKREQILLVISGTGSGKTVLLPKLVLHYFDYKGKIAITLPKRIIAKSAAEFAAETLDVALGKEVGYQFKGEKKNGDNLLYATDGTIVSILMRDPLLSDFNAVIIDEAHERKVQIDFLLYLLKNVVINRPEFKLVIMSATVNEQIFKDYFNQFKFATINIGAKTNYPIDSIFLSEPLPLFSKENNYIAKANEIIKHILKINKITESNKNEAHDILFFVVSVNETLDFCRINTINLDRDETICLEVFAGIKADKQELAQDRELYKSKEDPFTKKKYERKLVVATNVAESSLTIDGIKFVIDSGYELSSFYDPERRAKILNKQLISHAQAKQRMGRAGRTESGTCYHLYTRDMFNNMMPKYPISSILNSNIYDDCLKLLNLPNVQTLDKLYELLNQFIEPPKAAYVDVFITILTDLNLIGKKDKTITELGRVVTELQIDPMFALSLIIAYNLNCSREVMLIISCLEVTKNNIGEIFIKPKTDNLSSNNNSSNMRKKFNDAIKKLKHQYGDHIVLYNIMNRYRFLKKEDKNKLDRWAYEKFIKLDVLAKINDHYHKLRNNAMKTLEESTNKLNISIDLHESAKDMELADKILLCFIYGFRLNTASANKSDNNNLYNTAYAKNVNIGKDSFINFLEKKPTNVIYTELFGMNGNFDLNCVSKIPTKLSQINISISQK